MDKHKQFPEPLNQHSLSILATKWAKRYRANRITLHFFADKSAAYGDVEKQKYALIFLLSGSPSPSKVIAPPAEYADSEFADLWTTVTREEAIVRGHFADEDSFSNVYAGCNAPSGYLDEWVFWPVFEGEELPSFASFESWELYPGTEKNPDKASIKPNARSKRLDEIKTKVRAKAEELWRNDPSITKADMAMHDEINSIPGASKMAEGTLQNWIKDLNTNRKPGRRPKPT